MDLRTGSLLGCGLGFLVLGTRLPVAAQQLELAQVVRVEPGASCLNAQALIGHIASWLGTNSVDATLKIVVRGDAKLARRVEFRVQRGASSTARRFEPGPEQCEDLHAVLGLAVALSIKASLLDQLRPPLPAAGAPTAHSSDSAPWLLAADLIAGYAVLPQVNFGGGVRAGRALADNLSLRLGAFAVTSLPTRLAAGPGRVQAQLVAARPELCARFVDVARAHVAGCTGLVVGAIFAHGSGFETSQPARGRFLALATALELRWDVSERGSLRAAFELMVPLEHTSFDVHDPEGAVIAEQALSAVGAFLSVGPAYRF